MYSSQDQNRTPRIVQCTASQEEPSGQCPHAPNTVLRELLKGQRGHSLVAQPPLQPALGETEATSDVIERDRVFVPCDNQGTNSCWVGLWWLLVQGWGRDHNTLNPCCATQGTDKGCPSQAVTQPTCFARWGLSGPVTTRRGVVTPLLVAALRASTLTWFPLPFLHHCLGLGHR